LAGQRRHEQAAAAAIAPGVPVAHEQLVVDAAAGLARLLLVEALPGAPQVRAAVGEGLGAEGDPAAVGREPVAADVEREGGELARLAAAGRHRVELLRTALCAQE